MSAPDTTAAPGDFEPVPSDPFAPLLDQATSRLHADSDLRLEISQELRAHLQDSAAEFRAAGLDDAAADAKAIEALGDAEALSTQLWQANRRRMRGRIAARWILGLVAAPVVVALSVSLIHGVLTVLSMLTLIGGMTGNNVYSTVYAVGPLQHAWAQLLQKVPAADRDVLESRGVVGIPQFVSDHRVEAAHAAAANSPNDPILYADYVTQLLSEPGLFDGDRSDLPRQTRLLEALDRGSIVEPENGYYLLIKAALMMDRSSRPERDPLEPWPDAPSVGEMPEPKPDRLIITNAAQFEQGLAALHEAAGRPYIQSHAIERMGQLEKSFPPTVTLGDFVLRCQFEISTLVPYLNLSRMAQDHAGTYAQMLAERGDSELALSTVEDERRIGIRAKAASRLIIDALVGEGLYAKAISDREAVLRTLGRVEAADRAAAMEKAEGARVRAMRAGPQHDLAVQRRATEAGVLQATMSSGAVFGMDFAPGRRAEYALADQAALATFVLALLTVAAAHFLTAFATRGLRRSGKATSLYIGWRRMTRVMLLGVALPVATYSIYTLSPWSGRGRGIAHMLPRLSIEYATLVAVVATCVRLLITRAIDRRLKDLGLPAVSRPISRWAFIVRGSLACCVVVVVTMLHLESPRQLDDKPSVVPVEVCTALAVCLIVYAASQFSGIRFRRRALANGVDVSTPTAPVSDVAAISPWCRRFPNWALLGLLFVLFCGSMQLGITARRNSHLETPSLAVAAAILITFVGLVCTWLLSKVRLARATLPTPLHSAIVPSFAGSVALTYAASALFVGLVGAEVLRWQERRAVRQFDSAGYAWSVELNHTPFRVLRDEAIAEQAAFSAPAMP